MARLFFPRARARSMEICSHHSPGSVLSSQKLSRRWCRCGFSGHTRLCPAAAGRLRFCRITIVVGEPLYFTAADLEGNHREVYPRLSQRVMDAIAALHLE